MPRSVAAADPPADLSGKYRCEGQDFDGDVYSGEVTITKNGETYLLTWDVVFPAKRAASKYSGVGLQTDGVLSASWAGAARAGVMVYKVEKGGAMKGRWTIQGNRDTRQETLVPISPEHENGRRD